jgi:hypothetical protein
MGISFDSCLIIYTAVAEGLIPDPRRNEYTLVNSAPKYKIIEE